MLILASLCLLSLVFFQSAPPNADIAPIIGLIMARALQLTAVVKVIVDKLLRDYVPVKWLPVVACLLGIVVDFGILALSATTSSGLFNLRNSVMAVFAGVLAGIGSKVVTDFHNTAREDEKPPIKS